MSVHNEESQKVQEPAQLNPQGTVFGLDVQGRVVDKNELSYKTSVFLTALFPFLAFRRPESRIFRFNIFPIAAVTGFIARLLTGKSRDGDFSGANKYVSTALSFMFLSLGTTVLVFFIVYTCFSFNEGHAFPTVGADFQWVFFVRSVLVIAVIQSTCYGLCHPNRDRIKMLSINMAEFDKDLSYVGVMHSFRKLSAWIMRKPFKLRWFTTFMSDSILLVVTFVFSVAFRIYIMIYEPDVATILHQTFAIYRGILTCGFIVYTLEFAPRVDEVSRGSYEAALIVLFATQISDFFLFVSEKAIVTNLVMRWIASIGQLYITHSAALLAVIRAKHHMHTHLSPDLTWFGFAKIMFIVLILGGLWTAFTILRYVYAYDFEGEYNTNWIVTSYPYIYWPLSVAGGILFCFLGLGYLLKPSHETLSLISLRSKHAVLVNERGGGEQDTRTIKNSNEVQNDLGSSASSSRSEGSSQQHHQDRKETSSISFDFDITLILITFVVACLYYMSNFYASIRGSHWTTMAYYFTIPIAPIGLGAFALSTWIKPPRQARLGLYGAMFITYMFLISVMSYEDCEISADVPLCCEYPWLPDQNHVFEEPHTQPSCTGLLNGEDQCMTFMVDLGPDAPEARYVVPLQFSAVYESTRGFQIDGYVVDVDSGELGEHFFSELSTEVESVIETEICQPKDLTQYTRNGTNVYNPGCYGQYLYTVTGEDALKCDRTKNITCAFFVSTLNCAFMKSEPIPFITVVLTNETGVKNSEAHTAMLPGRDVPDSSFFNFFRLVGLAGLLECFFCIFGVVLKIIFLTECRTDRVERAISVHSGERGVVGNSGEHPAGGSSGSRGRRVTIIYSGKSE